MDPRHQSNDRVPPSPVSNSPFFLSKKYIYIQVSCLTRLSGI
jgi:hypothetical protein